MLSDIHRNIFLVGFMGSGKSYWGRIWAKEHGLSFYDLDEQIEKAFGMSVEKIFEKHGEAKFRELERFHLRKFENKRKYLMACGGGAPCFYDNLDWMLNHGKVIYLKASPNYILDRVMSETDKRPLLKEVNTSELLFFIQKKLKEREPKYRKAHFILEVEKLSEGSLDFLKDSPLKKSSVGLKKNIDRPEEIADKKIIQIESNGNKTTATIITRESTQGEGKSKSGQHA